MPDEIYARDRRESGVLQILKWSIAAIAVGLIVGLFMLWTGLTQSVNVRPEPRASDTSGHEPYEAFYTMNAKFRDNVDQIKAQVNIVRAVEDGPERRRVDAELIAMRKACRDLADRYNASAARYAPAAFEADRLPPRLDPAACVQ